MMSKTTTTRYDIAEHLRTPEEMATYPALWANLSAKQPCNKATHCVGCPWTAEIEILFPRLASNINMNMLQGSRDSRVSSQTTTPTEVLRAQLWRPWRAEPGGSAS